MTEPIGCFDECGAKSPNPASEGWYLLEATGRWRCPTCARALAAVNGRPA